MQGIREYDERGHEPEAEPADLQDRDVKVLGVVIAFAGIILAVFVIAGVVAVALNFFTGGGARTVGGNDLNPGVAELGPRYTPDLPPEPRLQVNEPVEWDALQATWQEELSTYGRTERGEVRIPVDRAMKMIVDRKLIPARDVPDTGQGAITEQDQQTQDSTGGQNSAPEEDK